MAYRPPVTVFDACVPYPFHTCNLLVQCAVDRSVDARWTDRIHDEWVRNFAAKAPPNNAVMIWLSPRISARRTSIIFLPISV